MGDETLRRCPFCGARAAWLTESGFMECGHCTATGPADGAQGWNRRPIEDALRAARDAAVARAEAAEAEVARWRSPHGEIDMLLPDVERVLLVAELGARLAPDIAADWMPRARSALAALRARDLGASAALEGAQRRYLEAEAEVAHLRAALRGDR